MLTDDWHGLYSEGWKGEIVEEAFKHPAKFSRALVRHIYQHCRNESWLAVGDAVCDPFGGVALGALDAMRLGLHWTGVELEPKFAALGNANIDAWAARYARQMPTWGTARLLQGDSRQLGAVVSASGLAVSSPPYAVGLGNGGTPTRGGGRGYDANLDAMQEGYGTTDGQLAHLKASDSGFAAAISSPPYSETRITDDYNSAGQDETLYRSKHTGTYGHAPGQLGAMRAGGFEAVSSPPFLDNNVNIGAVGDTPAMRQQIHNSTKRDQSYGATPGQLGNDGADDFWTAARAIVEQVYSVLQSPGIPVPDGDGVEFCSC
jgi:hypothetical protein